MLHGKFIHYTSHSFLNFSPQTRRPICLSADLIILSSELSDILRGKGKREKENFTDYRCMHRCLRGHVLSIFHTACFLPGLLLGPQDEVSTFL
jgi:hypothetical protein